MYPDDYCYSADLVDSEIRSFLENKIKFCHVL